MTVYQGFLIYIAAGVASMAVLWHFEDSKIRSSLAGLAHLGPGMRLFAAAFITFGIGLSVLLWPLNLALLWWRRKH